MRVLAVHPGPAQSVGDVHRGWVKGLRKAGATVVDLAYDRRLNFYETAHVFRNGRTEKAFETPQAVAQVASKQIEAAAFEVWPDVVLFVNPLHVHPATMQLLQERGMHVVVYHTEAPYEDGRQLPVGNVADTVLVNDPHRIDAYRQVNPRTFYQPHSYDPDVHYPGEPEPDLRSDLVFVGTGFPSRYEFLQRADLSGVDVKLAGYWGKAPGEVLRWCIHDGYGCDNQDTARLYRSAKASFNLYRTETSPESTPDGWAIGPREVELAACGTFFLRDPRGESDELFPSLPTFTTPEDFSEQLRWWLARDDLRRKAAEEARRQVADRTFETHARTLLQRIEKGKP